MPFLMCVVLLPETSAVNTCDQTLLGEEEVSCWVIMLVRLAGL